ncbi:hypothetical protein MNBD_GAMMA15-1601 [hydrothermal vent metagenome]|uniref:Prepilin-type N-terminal cleavage/methylation domain-containing protein n=1 Tax=hydrothermal vent metagenome TaxID=652676 RepID=A0A3B0Y635_9ZZZZ
MMHQRTTGFTLLEMVVTIATLSILAMLVTPYLSLSVRAYNDNAVESKILGELRYASERIARELRELRRNPTPPPSDFDIATPFASNRIIFFRNDGERVTIDGTAPLLNISYQSLQADTLFPLSTSLQSLGFTYLQSDEAPALSGSDLAYITFEIQLVANGQTYRQRSRVALRAQP